MAIHRLIATLGPGSFEHEQELVQAGSTEFRLNASHLSPVQVRDHLIRLRALLPNVPCVIDLQGKKMRIGDLAPRRLEPGDRVTLTTHPHESHDVLVPHPELFEQTRLGESLTLDDDRIELAVVEKQAGSLIGVVRRPGTLLARKGINRPCHPIELRDLPEPDQRTIELCHALGHVSFAVSFASDGSEAGWVRKRAPQCPVVLKVERDEAIRSLSDLADNADELWICRGDLGAQLGLTRMARVVSEIQPRNYLRPVLMAGQVLQHLCEHDTPTRSEVCHLHDLLTRGYSGIVLSDETAVGRAPALAVRWASRLMAGDLSQA